MLVNGYQAVPDEVLHPFLQVFLGLVCAEADTSGSPTPQAWVWLDINTLLDGISKCLQGHGIPLTLLQEGMGMEEPYSNVRYKGEQNKLGQADFFSLLCFGPLSCQGTLD